MKIILALPAYNEEEALPHLLGSLRSAAFPADVAHIVIVDDGSTDRTREVIESWSALLPMELVLHPVNCGLGKTILDALERAAALAGPDDAIVTMDADNTHSPALIEEMTQRLAAGFDIVIASRYRRGSATIGLSAFRHFLSFGARILFQVLFPIRGVRDYTCGFRAYRAAFLQKALERYGESFVTEQSFACMAEILLKSAKIGARVSEVPMTLHYDRKAGVSKMRVWRTVWRTIGLMVRVSFTRA